MHLLFVERETTDDYFAFVSGYLELHGKPLGFYSDKHAIFRNHMASKSLDLTTQFARAMNELYIELTLYEHAADQGTRGTGEMRRFKTAW